MNYITPSSAGAKALLYPWSGSKEKEKEKAKDRDNRDNKEVDDGLLRPDTGTGTGGGSGIIRDVTGRLTESTSALAAIRRKSSGGVLNGSGSGGGGSELSSRPGSALRREIRSVEDLERARKRRKQGEQ